MLKTITKRGYDWVFDRVHGRRLVFNACWEDPRIDRELMGLDGSSRVLVITSAGCNVLDYLLDDPAEVHAVDVNPRQNAVLWMKLCLLGLGRFEDLRSLFLEGRHERFGSLLLALRGVLTGYAAEFWGQCRHYADGGGARGSYYFHGASGDAAWLFGQVMKRLQPAAWWRLHALVEAADLAEQERIYAELEPLLWSGLVDWLVRQPFFLSLLGIPRPQADLILRTHTGGMVGYVQDCCRHVATKVPMRENYFWRVYVKGRYEEGCCPNYLKRENMAVLRERVGRVRVENLSVTEHLRRVGGAFSHFVLLDHQDWLAWHDPAALREEWEEILGHSRCGTKILLRSAGPELDFLPGEVVGRLRFRPDLTGPLHSGDRVGTYASVHLAEVL
jgi:S-adenosylmethionine-diacylglycerol 3-amino-3-carboxypropyl transferase